MKIKIFLAIFVTIFFGFEEVFAYATTQVPEKCEEKDCETKAKQCEPGFWGSPCKKCECGDRADACDYKTGNCFCNSKGVTGDKCDKCDEKKLYKADSTDGKCYYDLFNSNFVFKLTSPANKHIRNLNLKFSAEDSNDNIIFSINCSEMCESFELIIVAKEEGKDDKIVINKQQVNGNTRFERVLSHKEYKFGMEKEKPFTEFYIHINGFKSPTVFNINVIPESKKNDNFIVHYEA